MKTKFLEEKFAYKGSELRPLFLYEKGLKGNAMLSWLGPCDVPCENLVDAEDRVQSDFIKAKEMVHFVAEFFHKDIFFGICIQRLMAEIVIDVLKSFSPDIVVERKGDDLYIGDKKLNVSIATKSALSSLIHFGINVDSEGAPVKAIGLKDLDVEPKEFASFVLERVAREFSEIEAASVKVFSV